MLAQESANNASQKRFHAVNEYSPAIIAAGHSAGELVFAISNRSFRAENLTERVSPHSYVSEICRQTNAPG